jgi:hemerythrin superfamily protein
MQAHRDAAHSLIADHFLADHRRLELLMTQLLDAFAADDREELAKVWNDLDAGLTAHMEAEERHLIPALEQTDKAKARRILNGHQAIRAALFELGAGIDLHIVRADAAQAFVAQLREHARMEDELLYPWIDAHLGEPERASIIASLADLLRDKLQARAPSGTHRAKHG